jgi:AcrR family transcriptional regulator
VSKTKTRAAATEALMALAAERPWSAVTLEAIAERADTTLAALRADYDGRLAILADYVRGIDEAVLKDLDAGLAEEPVRERLFDILFARFEAHRPHRAALKAIGRAALVDPLLALELNRITVNAMVWMLTAAGITATGARGVARAQALALVWARVMRTFLEDDDPGLGRTMAALDKRLREVERVAGAVGRIESVAERVARRRERQSPPATEPPVIDAMPAEGGGESGRAA